MPRLTREEIENIRRNGVYAIRFSERTDKVIELCDLALQSLSQEAVRDEALEEAAKVALTVLRREIGKLPANVNAHDFGYAYAKGGNEMSQDIYNAIRALKK